MATSTMEFEQLLYDELIPEYCSNPERNCQPAGFRAESIRISEEDAQYFLIARKKGLILSVGSGRYRAPASNVTELFFWEGRKAASPRPFTLWLEPVITFAGLARLHLDHGWPIEKLGTQSIDWAFDIVAYAADPVREHIAGEVKKASRELDELILMMKAYGSKPSAADPGKADKRRNAFKKVEGLRARQAPIFWALGPMGDSRVYEASYSEGGAVALNLTNANTLKFPEI